MPLGSIWHSNSWFEWVSPHYQWTNDHALHLDISYRLPGVEPGTFQLQVNHFLFKFRQIPFVSLYFLFNGWPMVEPETFRLRRKDVDHCAETFNFWKLCHSCPFLAIVLQLSLLASTSGHHCIKMVFKGFELQWVAVMINLLKLIHFYRLQTQNFLEQRARIQSLCWYFAVVSFPTHKAPLEEKFRGHKIVLFLFLAKKTQRKNISDIRKNWPSSTFE